MFSLIHSLPTKWEHYPIASVKLTDEQLWQVARECVLEANCWHDDPRQWPNYEGFLGFQIAKAIQMYSIGQSEDDRVLFDSEEMDKFVNLVFTLAYQ